ncbi:MAG: hypothetical protein WC899_12055 [bacterium]|jgi:hypothetical protein
MKKPAYYLAVFGKPEPPEKDTADSGRYPLGIRGTDTPGDRGDILLLCCAAGQAENSMSVPGIGIVLTKTKESIFYRYLPFSTPVSKEQLDKALTDEDRNKFSGIQLNTYWLFDMSHESFRNATRGLMISWP